LKEQRVVSAFLRSAGRLFHGKSKDKVKAKMHRLDIVPFRSETTQQKHSSMAYVLKRFQF